jgi:hypothetical protein
MVCIIASVLQATSPQGATHDDGSVRRLTAAARGLLGDGRATTVLVGWWPQVQLKLSTSRQNMASCECQGVAYGGWFASLLQAMGRTMVAVMSGG